MLQRTLSGSGKRTHGREDWASAFLPMKALWVPTPQPLPSIPFACFLARVLSLSPLLLILLFSLFLLLFLLLFFTLGNATYIFINKNHFHLSLLLSFLPFFFLTSLGSVRGEEPGSTVYSAAGPLPLCTYPRLTDRHTHKVGF